MNRVTRDGDGKAFLLQGSQSLHDIQMATEQARKDDLIGMGLAMGSCTSKLERMDRERYCVLWKLDLNIFPLILQNGLLVACFRGFKDIVILLSKCSYIDVNHQDNDGNTALMVAAQAGRKSYDFHTPAKTQVTSRNIKDSN